MRIFLIINLLIVIINSYEYRINNNCTWPDDCYITMKFTKTCAIESATIQPANMSKPREKTIKTMAGKESNFQCFGFPKESVIRCYNRCDRSPIDKKSNIPQNHMYQYTSDIFKRDLDMYKILNSSEERIRVEDFGYGKVQKADKKDEYKFWNECVLKGLINSTSILTNKESKAAVKLDLKCDQSGNFCRFIIEYTLDGIKSITSEKIIIMEPTRFYSLHVYSCRIYEKTVECICVRGNHRCHSFDHLIESIYLLGRDKITRGYYPEEEDTNRKEYDENIPKVLEMLQKFRIDYPKNIYGSNTLDCAERTTCSGSCSRKIEINDQCDLITSISDVQIQSFILPHRFVDIDKTGSIAVEVVLKKYGQLYVRVYCRLGCSNDELIYVYIMDILRRQMETNDDIVLFSPDEPGENKEEYFACVYYSMRGSFLKKMYDKYDIPSEQPETIRKKLKPNFTISLIISTILPSIIVVLSILIMVIGTISYIRSQTKKEPITFSKKTVIARRKKPIGKSAEFANSKDKTGDFYDCVSKKTSTMNHTDLASTVEEAKSRE